MTLLFFWQPIGTGTPTPPPEPEAAAPSPGDIGTGPYPRRDRRISVHDDDEDIMAVIASFITQRRH